MQTPPIGQLLGNYRILRLVKRTGMSAVYLARDVKLQRDVIVKTMLPAESGDASFAARFEQEALVTARLAHPNIVHIYDFGREGELSYMVMEYLPGGSLYDVCERLRREGRPFDHAQAAQIGIAISAALHHAHAAGIVHRDVKPSNILFAADGRPVLVDLGISKVREGPRFTRTATSIGTPEYMSPEQARGESVDARTDIYSLGVVLYELLAGALPFQSDTPWGLIYKHIQQPPPPLPPAVPPALRSVVEKALAKRPADRFASGAEMAVALRRALEVPAKRLYTPPPQAAPADHVSDDAREKTRLLRPESPSTQPGVPGAQPKGFPFAALAGGIAALVLVVFLGAFALPRVLSPSVSVEPVTVSARATSPVPLTATPNAPAAAPKTDAPAVPPVLRTDNTPAATATPAASATASPVPTARMTATSRAQPIRSTATARPTVPIRPSVPVPVLRDPNGSSERAGVTFIWELPGYALSETQGFAVLVWKSGADGGSKGLNLPSLFNACDRPSRAGVFSISDLSLWPGYSGDGEYQWTVIVVDTAIKEFDRCKQISEQAEPHRFMYSRAVPAPAPQASPTPSTGQ